MKIPFHLPAVILGLTVLTPLSAFAQAADMTLVWSDEFDYTGLPDATKWSYDVGGSGWGNNELQYYTEERLENARVEAGVLVIEAIKEAYGRSSQYTSARLISKEKGDWLYGRFEIRAKLPSGRGTWPAIWMLPTDWVYGGWPDSGEIDIMEHVGYDMNVIHGTVHTEDFNHVLGTQVGTSIEATNVDTEFHLYSLEWRPNRIDVFLDETLYFSFANDGNGSASWPFDQRFHLLLNIAIGGSWGGVNGVDDSIFPQRMEVDYVRVYELADLSTDIEIPVPGRFEAEDFSANFGVRTQTTTDAGGGLNLGYLADGDWMEYLLMVETAGRYALDVRYASPNGTAGLTATVADGEPWTRMFTVATGGWQNWSTATLGEFNLPAGKSTLRITAVIPTTDDINLNWFELRLLEASKWAGYPIEENNWANSGDFLGYVFVQYAPWIFALDLNAWIYLPEDSITDTGAWMYITK